MQDFWAFLWKAIALLGGLSVISGAVGGFVAKFFADRSIEQHKDALGQETERLKGELAKETETHKLKLKRQEILFEKELDAAADFSALYRLIEPRFRHPDMDWDEALEDVVKSFTDTEARLRQFIAKHAPVLSQANRNYIDACSSLASANQFAFPGMGGPAMKDARDAAEKLLDLLGKIETRFIQELRQ